MNSRLRQKKRRHIERLKPRFRTRYAHVVNHLTAKSGGAEGLSGVLETDLPIKEKGMITTLYLGEI